MSILVTGATGFLGSNLCQTLVAQKGPPIIALGRNPSRLLELKQLGARLKVLSTDLRLLTTEAIESLKTATHIIHCAALSSPFGQKSEFISSNVGVTRSLGEAALRSPSNPIFIYISSPSIYADLQDRLGIKEDDPLPKRFLNHYAASKWEAEEVIRGLSKKGLKTIILRPQAIIGRQDPSILPRLISANQKRGLPVFKKEVWLDLTPVATVCQAILKALDPPNEALGQAFNISNGSPRELKALLEMFFRSWGEPLKALSLPLGFLKTIAPLSEALGNLRRKEPQLSPYLLSVLGYSRTLDITKAKGLLGLSPECRIEDALEDYIGYRKACGL